MPCLSRLSSTTIRGAAFLVALSLAGCAPSSVSAPALRVAQASSAASPAPRDAASASLATQHPAARRDFAVDVQLPSALAFEAFTAEIHLWWDHHFSKNPYRFVFEPVPGGRFYELFDAQGNGAEHARIIFAIRGEEVRFVGPLGLSGKAVEFVHTLRFAAKDANTTAVSLRVEALGVLRPEEQTMVEAVWQHFLDRYQDYCAARAKHPLFAQLPQKDSKRVGLGFFSHEGIGKARNHVHADDFRVETGATLKGIAWWGHLDGSGDDRLEELKGFVVRIHEADPDGSPGKILHEQKTTLAATQPSFSGRRAPKNGDAEKGPREWKHYLALSQPLQLNAATTYFVSVAAERKSATSEPWQWSDAETRNGLSFSRALHEVGWRAIQDTDSAFELELAQ